MSQFVPSDVKIANKAASTASLIGVLKWILLVLNAIGSVVYIAVGVQASKPKTTFTEEGFAESDSNPFGMLFVAGGVMSLVVGTVLVLVLFGWFQHMLATNAELVRQASDHRYAGGQA
jgi:hypothetical protein